MKLYIHVVPNAKMPRVERKGEAYFLVAVKEPPREGKANRAVIEALAEYFGVSRSDVSIVSGRTSREKIIEIAV